LAKLFFKQICFNR